MSEEDLDKRIDQAVRDLMNVDTDAAFRMRVLARLERRPRLLSWRRVTVAAAAASAVVVVAVVLMRSHVPDMPQEPTSNIASTQLPEAGQGARLAEKADNHLRSRVAQAFRPAKSRPAPPRSQRRLVAAAAEATPGIEIEPLTEIEAIRIAPVEQRSIAPSQMVIEPLTPIAQVEVAPLSPQPERD